MLIIDLLNKHIQLPLSELKLWFELKNDRLTIVMLDRTTEESTTMNTTPTQQDIISLTETQATEILNQLDSSDPLPSHAKKMLRVKLQELEVKRKKTKYFTLELPQTFDQIVKYFNEYIENIHVPEKTFNTNVPSLVTIYTMLYDLKEEIRNKFPDVNPQMTHLLFETWSGHLTNINTAVFNMRCTFSRLKPTEAVDFEPYKMLINQQTSCMRAKLMEFTTSLGY